MSDNVLEIYEDLRGHYSNMHAQMQDSARFINQMFDGLLDIPYDVRVFRSATAANIVQGFRNQIRTEEPTVILHPAGPSIAARKDATLMQRWGYAQLRREREFSIVDPNLECGYYLLARGAATKKILVDIDNVINTPPKRGTNAYKTWEHDAMSRWPYKVRAIDPLSIFPIPSSHKPVPGILERQVRYAGDMEAQYPDWKNPDTRKRPARAVEWLEYWTKDSYTVYADGGLVFDKENPYGFIPYIFEWSGLGHNDSDGNPAHLAEGILTSILGELAEEVRLKTAISVQTQMHVFPPILTVEDPQKVATQFGVGPGKVIQHIPGHPPTYMEYPPPNENMYRFLEVIQSNISRVMSKALSGGRDPGVRYGVLQAQMIGQALTTMAPVINVIDSIGSQTLNMMAHMAKVIDFNMVLEGTQESGEAPHRLSGKNFEHLNFDVTFEAVDPAENDRALLVGEAMRRAGDLSQKTFWKKYAKHIVEDADEEEINLLEEQLMTQLVASGQLGAAVLSEDVQEQMTQQMEGGVEQAQEVVQDRRTETVPESASVNAQQLETIAGRPGSHTIPRDVAEQGMRPASPSRSGLPRTGQMP